MDYEKRIGDEYLVADYKDGDVLQHTDLNELNSIVKTAINENYKDIQKIENGEIPIGFANSISGASLSKSTDGTLGGTDNTIPSSKQAKDYIDNLIGAIPAPEHPVVPLTNGTEENPVIICNLENGTYIIKDGCWFKYFDIDDPDYLGMNPFDTVINISSLDSNGSFCDFDSGAIQRVITAVIPGRLAYCYYIIPTKQLRFVETLDVQMAGIPNYKFNGNQVLKNINGTPTWVDEV